MAYFWKVLVSTETTFKYISMALQGELYGILNK